METRSLGITALAFAALLGACSGETRSAEQKASTRRSSLTGQAVTQRVAWGEGPGQLGFRPALRESLPMGAPAVGVGPGGQIFVLDALNERVVKVTKGDVVPVAKVPRDADDLAIGADGAIAVLRQQKPEVLVFTPTGESVGPVDVSAVHVVDAIALGTSRRVVVTSEYQETFLFGSPSMPQLAAAVRANKREGAAQVDGLGVVAVKGDGGALELRLIEGGAERSAVVAAHALGKGDAARVVGAASGVACVRVEHVGQDARGELTVEREAVCLDAKSGTELLRTKLPPQGAYAPRRELAFSGSTLAFARADGDGLEITTWTIEGGAR